MFTKSERTFTETGSIGGILLRGPAQSGYIVLLEKDVQPRASEPRHVASLFYVPSRHRHELLEVSSFPVCEGILPEFTVLR